MKNNKIIRLAGVLFLICAISAGALAWLNDSTKDIIAENELKASMDPAVIAMVAPGAETFIAYEDAALIETIKAENDKFVNLLTAVDSSNNSLGYVVRTFSTVAGFGGDMELFVGISPEGKITGTSVIAHTETSGLGSRVAEPDFMTQFVNKDAATEVGDKDYTALTGATYSSKSFTSAVNNAISIYKQYLK